MPKLHTIYETYKSTIPFQFVYILEAHAQDEWPIRSARWVPNNKPVLYNQTKTVADRMTAAKDFVKDYDLKMPFILDSMSNDFEKLYAPWPVRIYIIENGKITYKAQPAPDMLEMKEFISALQKLGSRK